MMKKKTRIVYRSSITGKFVSKEFAEKNPDTTQRQVIKTLKGKRIETLAELTAQAQELDMGY